MADDEQTLADLRGRIARTVEYLEEADPAAFDGREGAEIKLSFPSLELTFTGQSLVTDFTLPNFFFHMTTAYALLRANGVPLGKMDYLAGGRAAPLTGGDPRVIDAAPAGQLCAPKLAGRLSREPAAGPVASGTVWW